MQLCHVFTALVFALGCAEGVVGGHMFERRQDSTNTETLATSARSTLASSTNEAVSSTRSAHASHTSTGVTSSAASIASSSQPSSTGDSSFVTTSRTTPLTKSGTIVGDTAVTTTSSPATQREKLPIQPKTTPAVGLAGFILIATGTALCLVGIKHKWLYIFLSTAFLASLGVTVLVVYVMDPPVSDGVQGAYLTAAVITGLIFGALSLVFKDVTEGLGCLLGGFCLAMWFLVLAPGGIIHSTSGRAILIAAFCLASFALSFSHYTRNYGLIFGTAFAGAQIAITGVDCFSRAGLKEFWLYLWNLNGNEFPLYTTTYPITRGIRVEVACTVIIFIFGLMSQFKIWKVVQERKAKKDEDRMHENEVRNELEEAVGRNVEEGSERDRARWEAKYGNTGRTMVHVDSGVGSSIESLHKRSASVGDREVHDIELVDMPDNDPERTSEQARRPMVTVRIASEDESPEFPMQSEEHLLNEAAISQSVSMISSPMESHRTSIDDHPDGTFVRDRSQSSVTAAGPTIVPLPFSIPGQDDEEDAASDRRSIISKGTAGLSVLERHGVPLTRFSFGKIQRHDHKTLSPDEDDARSSVDATADEDADADPLSASRLSALLSPYELDADKDGLLSPFDYGRDRSCNPGRHIAEIPVEEEDDEAIVRPETVINESVPRNIRRTSRQQQQRRSTASSHRRSLGSRRSIRDDHSEEHIDKAPVTGSLTDHLPEKLSKVAMTYRTNEWAKHIAEADKPEMGSYSGRNSPGMQIEQSFADETAKPVDMEALRPAEAPQAYRVLHTSKNNPYRHNRAQSNAAATPIYASTQNGPFLWMHRQGSNGTLRGQPRLATQRLRNVSAPFPSQPFVESPVENPHTLYGHHRNASMPVDLTFTNNLLDERYTRLQHKPTSTSFNALYSPSNFNVIGPSDSASCRSARLDEPDSDNMSLSERKQLLEEDNMTLAERRSLIHEQVQQRQGTWPLPGQKSMTTNQNIIYDSHQPRRTNTIDSAKQSNMLAQWRQSLEQDAASRQPLLVDEHARNAMVNERRQVELQNQLQYVERERRQNSIDVAMRSGQFHDAHRDALRRMQAKANKRAPQ